MNIKFLCIVDVLLAVNNTRINRRVLPWKHTNGFPLHCCLATLYFILLSTLS